MQSLGSFWNATQNRHLSSKWMSVLLSKDTFRRGEVLMQAPLREGLAASVIKNGRFQTRMPAETHSRAQKQVFSSTGAVKSCRKPRKEPAGAPTRFPTLFKEDQAVSMGTFQNLSIFQGKSSSLWESAT